MKNSETELIVSSLYGFIQTNRWISFYSNGNKYFLFVLNGRIRCLSEFSLSLILSSALFLGVIGIRKLVRRLKLKRDFSKKTRIRGGDNSLINQLDKTEILQYEEPLGNTLIYGPIALLVAHYRLTARQKFIKSIIKKCFRPGQIYKITNRGLLEIIDRMMSFQKRDSLKFISYDTFVLALTIGSKIGTRLVYVGTSELVKKIGSPFLIEHSPIIAALLTAFSLALRFDLNAEISVRFIWMLIKSATAFNGVGLLRSQYWIDCTDYVSQLPQADIKDLQPVQTGSELDSSCSSSSKLSYTREYPSRHETFVSTSPNAQLHYQEAVPIETLDGTIKQTQKLNGEKSITWVQAKDPTKNKPIGSKYIPLAHRTRTLDDVKKLDSTFDREAASQVIRSIRDDQRISNIIKDGE